MVICLFSKAQLNYTIVYTHSYGVDSFFKKSNYTYSELYGALLVQGDSLIVYRLSKTKKELLLPYDMNNNKVHHSSIKYQNSNFSYNVNFNNRKTAQFIIDPDKNYDWKVENDSTIICGFRCMKARSYTGLIAWYTPSLSAKFGPFSFTGLPGTILKLYDIQNFMLIEANKIVDICPPIIFPKDKMQIVTWEQAKEEIRNNQKKKKANWFFN
jgi:GLPGLI family protein